MKVIRAPPTKLMMLTVKIQKIHTEKSEKILSMTAVSCTNPSGMFLRHCAPGTTSKQQPRLVLPTKWFIPLLPVNEKAILRMLVGLVSWISQPCHCLYLLIPFIQGNNFSSPFNILIRNVTHEIHSKVENNAKLQLFLHSYISCPGKQRALRSWERRIKFCV